MDQFSATAEGSPVGTNVPDRDDLFVDEPTELLEADIDRYLRKPDGKSDQGYKED